ncbi:MAG: hypothetical protein SGCHY_003303 [Lobulomycetales sp.]
MSISNSQRDRSCERIDEKDETTAATGDDWEDADVKVTFVSKHDEEEMGKHFRFFHENLADDDDLTDAYDFACYLTHEWGFKRDDPRFKKLYASLMKDEHNYKTDIPVEEFIEIVLNSDQSILLQKAFSNDLIIPGTNASSSYYTEFPTFCEQVKEIFNDVYAQIPATQGANASYIPQLSKINPDLWGLSVCTVDGQRLELGNAQTNFCVQSCVKPLLYCAALEEWGTEKILQHVGREPSGVEFNSLTMNKKGIPHNPMINAGAIMSCSLVKPKLPLAERFEHLMELLGRMTGGFDWGFSNTVYLSEKASADANFCLAYIMRRNNAFPVGTDMMESLDFYFQACSVESCCSKLAVAGATIAHGGVCPLTGEKVLEDRTCRDVLSLMSSCGMYDYSGEWAFSIGIPAKSGVSGVIYAIIPGFGCITTYAPPLDEVGNSVRGVEFFKRLVQIFTLHSFDSVIGKRQSDRINPTNNKKSMDRIGKISALYAASEGDLSELQKLIFSGVPATISDYDGRTLLHLAACENHVNIVKYLLRHHVLDIHSTDRWGGTPLTEAIKNGNHEIVRILKKYDGKF